VTGLTDPCRIGAGWGIVQPEAPTFVWAVTWPRGDEHARRSGATPRGQPPLGAAGYRRRKHRNPAAAKSSAEPIRTRCPPAPRPSVTPTPTSARSAAAWQDRTEGLEPGEPGRVRFSEFPDRVSDDGCVRIFGPGERIKDGRRRIRDYATRTLRARVAVKVAEQKRGALRLRMRWPTAATAPASPSGILK